MKSRWPLIVLSALVAVVLSVVISVGRHEVDATHPSTVEGRNASLPEASYRSKSKHADAPAIKVPASGLDSPHSARGAGYAWGKALRELYARRTIDDAGKTHLDLDLTALRKSLSQFKRPVDLEDTSALPLARAEYLAAVITAALDLTADSQARLAEVLESYYTSDLENRGLDEAKRKDERARLTTIARKHVLDVVPEAVQGQFNEVFASKDFLFRSMSLAVNDMTMQTSAGTMVAGGDVVFTADPDGAIQVQAENSSLVQHGNRPQRRVEPAP
jgi:hypothetical protein